MADNEQLVAACEPVNKHRSRPFGFGPNIFFIHVNAQAPAGVHPLGDQVFNIPESMYFLLVSCTQIAQNNSLFIHTRPLNKQYPDGDDAIHIDGTEEWFAMKALNGSSATGQMIKLVSDDGRGITQVFFDFGFEIGGGTSYKFTVACSKEPFDFRTDYWFGEF